MSTLEWLLAGIVAIYLAAFLYQILWRAREDPDEPRLNSLSIIGFIFVATAAILAFTTDIWADWLALVLFVVGIGLELFVWARRSRG